MSTTEVGTRPYPDFVIFREQMEARYKLYDYYRNNEMFKAGFVDGWYTHTIRGAYHTKLAYRVGLAEGKKQVKKQRLINLLSK